MNAEQIIKRELDGWLFRMSCAPGPESRPVVKAIKVPKSYIPDHRPTWDYVADTSGEPHHNAVTFTVEEDDKIITMRANGHRWADVAKTIKRCINLTRDRYKKLCLERGIAPVQRIEAKKPERLSDAVKAQIVNMREAGMSYDNIAAQMGLTRWMVADCVHKMNRRRAA